jgi:hypothetical protein
MASWPPPPVVVSRAACITRPALIATIAAGFGLRDCQLTNASLFPVRYTIREVDETSLRPGGLSCSSAEFFSWLRRRSCVAGWASSPGPVDLRILIPRGRTRLPGLSTSLWTACCSTAPRLDPFSIGGRRIRWECARHRPTARRLRMRPNPVSRRFSAIAPSRDGVARRAGIAHRSRAGQPRSSNGASRPSDGAARRAGAARSNFIAAALRWRLAAAGGRGQRTRAQPAGTRAWLPAPRSSQAPASSTESWTRSSDDERPSCRRRPWSVRCPSRTRA